MTRKYTLGNCMLLCICVVVLLSAGWLWCAFLSQSDAAWATFTAAEKDNICMTLLTFAVLAIPASGWLLWWLKGSQHSSDEQ